MKKLYIVPAVKTTSTICGKLIMIAGSDTTITSSNQSEFDFTKSDSGWDIWGSDDED